MIVYVGGKSAFEGVRFGHAGSMITKGKGTAESKTRALREVGAICVDHFFQVGDAARDILAQGRP
jgi:succinyl-CoA synthetase alpha subunit